MEPVCGVGTWGSNHYPPSLGAAHFPSPSWEPVVSSVCDTPTPHLSFHLLCLIATALNFLASSGCLVYLQGIPVSWPETKLEVEPGIILATSKPELLLLEQCLTRGTGLGEPFVFPFRLCPKPLAGRVLGLRPVIQLGGLCANSCLSGGQCIGRGLWLGLQP